MKSFKILCLTVLLCLSFCACQGKGGKAADASELTPELTVPSTQPSTASNAGDAVVVGREETYSYTDQNNSTHTTVYRIPALNFDTAEARQINGIINSMYSDAFNTAEHAQATQQQLPLASLDYSANLNDDVISLLIKSEDQSHTVTYAVFNYNKTTGQHMDNTALLEYLQLDYDQTFAQLKAALEDDYYSKFKYENFPDDYYYQLELTVGDTAVQASSLYLNENGELFAVCTERASVGKGEFQVLLKVQTDN